MTHPSRLGLRFSWFSETQFELQGRELNSSGIPLTQATSLIENDFLGNYEWKGGSNDVSNGYIIYNNLTSAIDDYIKQMKKYEDKLAETNEYNATVKRNKAIAKAFKAIILTATPSGAVASGISFAAALAGGAEWASDFQTHAKDLIEKDSIKFYKISKEMKTLLGGQFDYFINKNFKEKPAPTKPTGPSVGYAEMTFKGKLTDEVKWPGIDFLNPGTYHQNSDVLLTNNNPLVYKYPVYNDVLGSFALLESPKITISKNVVNDSTDYYPFQTSYTPPLSIFPWQTFYYDFHKLYQSWTNNYQFRLNSPLKYVFNTNLDIKNYDVAVSLSVETKRKQNFDHMWHSSSYIDVFYSCFLDPHFTTNLASTEIESNQYYPIYTTGDGYNNGSNYCISNLDCILVPASAQPTNKKSFKLTSPFFPINSISPMVYSVGLKNQIYRVLERNHDFWPINPSTDQFYLEFEFELKILLNIEFATLNEDGFPNTVTQVYTYRVPSEDINELVGDIYPNLENSPLNVSQYQEDLIIHDKIFDGSQVEGCKLVGNVYTCKAWNDVTLTGNINANPGYVVNIEAANEIKEINECVIQGEVNRQIVPVLDFSVPMPPVTSQYLVDYCDKTNNDSPYKANEPTKNLLSIIETENALIDSVVFTKPPLSFSLTPNPATQQSILEVNGENTQQVSIVVFSVTGIEQRISISGENGRYTLDLPSLAKGMYLVKVSTVEESQTKQLLIQ